MQKQEKLMNGLWERQINFEKDNTEKILKTQREIAMDTTKLFMEGIKQLFSPPKPQPPAMHRTATDFGFDSSFDL